MENFRSYFQPVFRVSDECLSCDSCRAIAPAIFAIDPATSTARVIAQPETLAERAAAFLAMDHCCVEAIQVSEWAEVTGGETAL